MTAKNDVKILLDGSIDEKLEVVERLTRDRLLFLIGENGQPAKDVPAALEYIVTNVTSARYNRIGNEGMTEYLQEGERLTFSDDDFKPYLSDIEKMVPDLSEAHSGIIVADTFFTNGKPNYTQLVWATDFDPNHNINPIGNDPYPVDKGNYLEGD
jgi:hypothetical protein